MDIPSSVTFIGDFAFNYCTELVNVTLSNSLVAIGDYAFCGCYKLSIVDMPNTLSVIGELSFAYCYNLTCILFSGDSPTIFTDAFNDVEVTALYPLNNSTWISDILQNYGGKITWLTYEKKSDAVVMSGNCGIDGENIKWNIFGDGTLVFVGNGEMQNYSHSTEVPWFKQRLWIKSITIDSRVTTLTDYAFDECFYLSNVELPNGISKVGEYVFANCANLTNIDISDSVTSIGGSAFLGCTSLASIDVPDSVTSIGDSAFRGCTNLTSINIPDSVISIGPCAFENCTSLASIDMPDSVTSIGKYAFRDCTSLTSINIPDSVISIGLGAFENCTSLASVDIPDSVTSIGKYALKNCTSLTSIYSHGDAPSIGFYTFYNVTATAYYPAGNITWTTDVMQNYGGNITWVPYGEDTRPECEKNGHKYESVVTEPTYTEQGYTTHTCSVCGDSYVDSYTDVLEPIHGDLNLDGVVDIDDVLICLDLCFEN